MAVKANVVQKSGAWFSFEGTRLGQGRDNVKIFFKENPDVAARVEAQLMENLDLLTGKTGAGAKNRPTGSGGGVHAAAKPVEPPVQAQAAPAVSKANIDILVED